MTSHLVSIIIVNWNGRKYLGNCLKSLSKVLYKNIEIIFVDNASSDDSVDFVKRNLPSCKIIVNTKNLGFAEGQEIAFSKAKGDSILLLNTDTIIEDNLISELVSALYSKSTIGAVQPKILLYPQKDLIDSVGAFFLSNGDLYHFGREKNHRMPIYNKPMEIFSAKGACILFRKEVLKKTGLFDKDYFAYFEETDLCMRILLAGYKIMYIPSAVVYHIGGGSSKQMASSFVLFHSYKNGIATYIKNLSLWYLIKLLPQMILFYELAFFGYLLQGNFLNAIAVQKAIWWNLSHIKDLLNKRKIIQEKIRVVPDSSFLPGLTKKIRLSYYYYQFFGGLDKYVD